MLKDGRTILYGGGQLALLSATDTVEGKETRRGVRRTRKERPREPRVVSSKFHLSIGGVVMNVAVNELRRCERAEKRSRGPLSDAGNMTYERCRSSLSSPSCDFPEERFYSDMSRARIRASATVHIQYGYDANTRQGFENRA